MAWRKLSDNKLGIGAEFCAIYTSGRPHNFI